MADAIVLPQNPPISISTKFLRLIPGVALLAVIGFAGQILAQCVAAYFAYKAAQKLETNTKVTEVTARAVKQGITELAKNTEITVETRDIAADLASNGSTPFHSKDYVNGD